jgi:hypothetical protein
LYLARVDWHLDWLAPGPERKRIVKSLREDIAAESAHHDVGAALAGLGDPERLALGYAGDARQGPRWSHGLAWSGIALFAYGVVFVAYVLGMLAVVEAAGLGQARSRFLLIEVTAYADQSGFGVGLSGVAGLLIPLIAGAVVFLLASRTWRAFRRPGSTPS